VLGDDWRGVTDQAYRDYAIYEAAGGAEQKVASHDGLQSRSSVIIDRLAQQHPLPVSGRLLDFGCGNGGFLSAFAARFPEWELDAAETDDRHIESLRKIPGFGRLYGVHADELPGRYDLISLVHVLEHLENPAAVLAALRGKASHGGVLLVEVPSWRTNPFALMIADHVSHFTPASLQMVVNAGGWTCSGVREDWVPKELSVVAFSSCEPSADAAPVSYAAEKEALQSAVDWLSAAMKEAKQIACSASNFGLFGSAIAATWLYQGMADRVRFFVDEDPQRVGRTHLGLPILAPDQVAADADVFVGVSPVISQALIRRLRSQPGRYHAAGADCASGVAAVC
jgi:trans-aconitate methyltransferase